MSGKFIKHGTTPTGVPRYRCLLCKDRGLKSTCAVEESSRQDPKAGLARDRCSRFRALLNGGHMRGTARTFRGKDSKWPWRTYTDLDFFGRIFRNWRRLHNERIRSGEIDLSAAREFGDGGKGGADFGGEAETTRNKHVIHDEQITVVTDIMSLALRTPGGHDNHEPLNLIISTLRPSHYVLAATPMFDGSVNWEDVLNSQMGLGGAHHLWPNAQYYGLGDVFRSKLRYESESEQRKYTPPLTGGLKVRDPYMLHAHFFLLRKLLSWSPMVVHYMDGEEVLGNACLWAFKDQIIAGRCEVLQVTSHRKGLEGAIDAQEDARRVAKQTDRGRANYDELLTIARETRSWRHGEGKPPATKKEKTFPVPLISKLDGMRSVTYLTETGVRSDREVVDLVLGASVTDVDGEIGWFRERVDFVSRAAHAAGTGTLSYKKNLGSPEVLQKIVAAYMFSKNNLWDHYQEDWVTPAAKLGLLKTPVSTEDLLDHPIGPHEY